MANKLFLGGVSPHTAKEDLDLHFGQYGTVIDSVVMYKDGKHRGFGFVTFQEDEAIEAVLAEQQIIHDRIIDVKPAVPGSEAPAPRPSVNNGCHGNGGACGAYGTFGAAHMAGVVPAPPAAPLRPQGGGKGGGKAAFDGATDKVFIGGLPASVTEDLLTEYFGRYGTIVDVVVMKDKLTQKPRGFGFVRYDSTHSVEAVMAEYDIHQLEGKWVEVKKAVPQQMMEPTVGGRPVSQKGPPMGKGGYAPPQVGKAGGGYGVHGGCGGYGAYAAPKGAYCAPAVYNGYGGGAGAYGGGKGGYRAQPY